MDFISFLVRHIIFIVTTSIIFGLLGLTYTLKSNTDFYKTTLFLTVANTQSGDPEQAELAATYFGETIVGWFRNPAFIYSINKNNQNVSFNAYKQERQNLLIEVVSDDKAYSKSMANLTWDKLNQEIKRYNQISKNSFVIIDQGKITKNSSNKNVTIPLIGVIIGLMLAIFIMAIKEFFKNEIGSIEEAENILQVKTTDFLKKNWEKNDYTNLSVVLQKSAPIVILAGVDIETDMLAVSLAHKHSYNGEKIALVDGDLNNRSLQKTLGLSNRVKNLKGHTDASINEEEVVSSSVIIQNTMDENLKFLPAGKGHKFLSQVFMNIATEMKILIHTKLPDNAEVLRLNNATLILVVQIGKTKIKNLKIIREIWPGDLKLVIAE